MFRPQGQNFVLQEHNIIRKISFSYKSLDFSCWHFDNSSSESASGGLKYYSDLSVESLLDVWINI